MERFLDQLEKAMKEFSDRDAFASVSAGKTVVKTFATVENDLERTVSWLQEYCKQGDRIAALTYNCVEAVILEWATYRLGGTWIGIPTLERDLGNLERLLEYFAPRLLLVEPAALGLYEMRTLGSLPAFPCEEEALPPHFDASRFRLLRHTGPQRDPRRLTVGEELVTRIRYTSGATGEPKAIAYTERTVVAILDNIRKVIKPTPKETIVHGLPSVWAAGSLIAPAFCRGGKNVLLPRWDLLRFVETVTREKRVLTFLVPSQVADLAQYSERSGADWARNLGRVLVAGGPAPISTMHRAKKALPDVHFFITFGQTEASFPITYHKVEDKDVRPETNSRPFVPLGSRTRPYEKSEVDPETGELKLRGEAVAAAKWDPKTRRFRPLGQPHPTGDLVAVDAKEVLHYVGRKGWLESVRQVWPAPDAVEALLREHPGVKRVRVDAFTATRDGVSVDVTVEPQTVDVQEATLIELFELRRAAANLAAVSLRSLQFGEVAVTMSGKLKREVKRDA